MKGFKLAAAVSAVAIGLGATGVATANQVIFNLEGTVTEVCGVFGTGTNTVNVGFGDLGAALTTDWITAAPDDVNYICNGANGFNRDITSQNAGVLENVTTPGDTVDYEMSHSDPVGGPAITDFDFGFADVPSIPSASFSAGDFSTLVTGRVTFRARGVTDANGFSTVDPGTYRDVVTLAVTAN